MNYSTPVPPLEGPKVAILGQLGIARGQNFWAQWIEGPVTFEASSTAEMLLLLPEAGADVSTDDESIHLPARSVSILPAGSMRLTLAAGVRATLIAHSRPDLTPAQAINGADYAKSDNRVKSVVREWQRVQNPHRIHVIEVDKIAAPLDKPRLKMFRTDCMSINWVEYTGARDRSALSPHSHADFEQGSLAIAGDFVHHLRTPWGGDANTWREDAHLDAPSPSMFTIPVHLVHTTEGTGQGRHLLIDIFSPAREDFIAKGWISNADDYVKC